MIGTPVIYLFFFKASQIGNKPHPADLSLTLGQYLIIMCRNNPILCSTGSSLFLFSFFFFFFSELGASTSASTFGILGFTSSSVSPFSSNFLFLEALGNVESKDASYVFTSLQQKKGGGLLSEASIQLIIDVLASVTYE